MPVEIDPRAMPATRATLDMLAGLDISIVIPGHGAPFTDAGAALERAYQRTAAFEASSLRVAKYALKALLSFALLDRRRLPLAEMPAYVDSVEIYRDFNQRFFRLPPTELAEILITELERAGAVRREAGWLLAA
jgi:hypothetical protein